MKTNSFQWPWNCFIMHFPNYEGPRHFDSIKVEYLARPLWGHTILHYYTRTFQFSLENTTRKCQTKLHSGPEWGQLVYMIEKGNVRGDLKIRILFSRVKNYLRVTTQNKNKKNMYSRHCVPSSMYFITILWLFQKPKTTECHLNRTMICLTSIKQQLLFQGEKPCITQQR